MAEDGEDLKDHPVPSPWGWVLPAPSLGCPAPIHGLGHLQGWDTHNYFGQPVPAPHSL